MMQTMLKGSSLVGTGLVSRSASRAQARSSVVVQAGRPLWLPGITPPSYLDGSLAADFGFDPLGLGKDPEQLKWYVQSELIHGRTAMTAVAGIIIPGLLTKAGLLSVPEWYDAGKVSAESSGIPFNALLLVEIFLCGFVEVKRWVDFNKPQSQGEPGSFFGLEGMFKGSGVNGYPGGIFDPAGLASEENKLKELKNGRLAMLAFLGFAAQYSATGTGPFDNLAAHLENPALNNFATNGVSLPAAAHPFL